MGLPKRRLAGIGGQLDVHADDVDDRQHRRQLVRQGATGLQQARARPPGIGEQLGEKLGSAEAARRR